MKETTMTAEEKTHRQAVLAFQTAFIVARYDRRFLKAAGQLWRALRLASVLIRVKLKITLSDLYGHDLLPEFFVKLISEVLRLKNV